MFLTTNTFMTQRSSVCFTANLDPASASRSDAPVPGWGQVAVHYKPQLGAWYPHPRGGHPAGRRGNVAEPARAGHAEEPSNTQQDAEAEPKRRILRKSSSSVPSVAVELRQTPSRSLCTEIPRENWGTVLLWQPLPTGGRGFQVQGDGLIVSRSPWLATQWMT